MVGEGLERPRPMRQRERAVGRNAMLLLRAHLAKSASMAVGPEDGIVAETRRAPWREHEIAVDPALERLGPAVRPGERQRADEMRPPRLWRARRQKLALDAGHRGGEVLGAARPARRIDARGAAERLDAKPGIVGERRFAGRPRRAGHNAALIAKLGELETEENRLKSELEAVDEAIAPEPAEITAEVEATLQSARNQIESLLSCPAHPDALELRERVRSMIERVVVNRRHNGQIEVTVRGRFAGVMAAAGLVEGYASKQRKAPAPGASGAHLPVVAGAGFEPAAFRL